MRYKLLKTLIFLLFLPYGLALIYLLVPPPSTLMLADWARFRRVERYWQPIDAMSPNLVNAVLTSEDSAFCSHYGVDFRQLEKSIQKAERRNKPVAATSTISQQLAKNLFLWPGRSWIRKALELPLTFWIELTWSKKRILEVYLNVAEWGDGIYGAEAASRHYFRTSAVNLNASQAALLATSLPNPRERNAARPGSAQTLLSRNVVLRMFAATPDMRCIR